MQVQRCGETSHMIWRVISGRLGVCFTSLLLWSLHSGQMICKACTRRYSGVFTQRFQTTFRVIWLMSQSNLYKFRHSSGQLVSRSCRCLLLSVWGRSFSWMSSMVRTCKVKMNCWAQSESPKIFFTSQIDFQNQCMTQRRNLDIVVWTKRRKEGHRKIKINFQILLSITMHQRIVKLENLKVWMIMSPRVRHSQTSMRKYQNLRLTPFRMPGNRASSSKGFWVISHSRTPMMELDSNHLRRVQVSQVSRVKKMLRYQGMHLIKSLGARLNRKANLCSMRIISR